LLVPLILSLGAYDIFREEKDGQSLEESNRFCEADIDQILSRSAVVIHDAKKSGRLVLQHGATILSLSIFRFIFSLFDTLHLLGALSASVASFSKASFVVSGGATNDVAIDDPDFWTKVVGLAGTYGTHVLFYTCRTDRLHPVPLHLDLAS
jgi:hypothetical protein